MSVLGLQTVGQLGRRDPREIEMSRGTPFVLTDRDVSILTAIHTHGFLTTELVELAYFSATGPERRSPSTCAYDRLRLLWLWRFVERVVRPATPGLGGRQPSLLTLGQRGVPVVAHRLGLATDAVRRRRLDRISPYGIAHDLAVARLWANLRATLDRLPGAAMRWTAERTLRARDDHVRDPETRRTLPFVPDAYAELDLPGDPTRCFLVEVDLGTLTLERFARKVRAFELFLAQGLFAQAYGRGSFRVLVVCPGDARRDNLVAVARSVVTGDRHAAYLFTRLDALTPRTFAGAIWRDLRGDHVPLLPGGAAKGRTDVRA